MNALQNGSRLAQWHYQTIAGYVVGWVEHLDGRTSPFCRVELPEGRYVHLSASGGLFICSPDTTVRDLYTAAEIYVAIVSHCFGWDRGSA